MRKTTNAPWKPGESAEANARRILPKLLHDYYKSGRKLDKHTPAGDMHGFRLKTKQLRYTLEAFAPLFDAEFESRMKSLRPIQNALGELNDCEVMLAEFRKRLPHAAKSYIRKRAGEKRDEFLRYWREEFDAANEEKGWEQCLTRFARSKRTAVKSRS